jgi:hypothetical protein
MANKDGCVLVGSQCGWHPDDRFVCWVNHASATIGVSSREGGSCEDSGHVSLFRRAYKDPGIGWPSYSVGDVVRRV